MHMRNSSEHVRSYPESMKFEFLDFGDQNEFNTIQRSTTTIGSRFQGMQQLIIGCGYLGDRVARAWRDRGDDVAALTRSQQHADRFRLLGIHPVIGDVTDPNSLSGLPEAQTVLYAVGFDRDSGHSQREVYVDGLRNVLDAIASRIDRFLYISSTSVYGQTDGEWVDETSESAPSRPNGRICLEAEHSVWQYFPPNSPTPVGNAIVLRLSGLYGPGRLLSRIESLKAGEPLGGNPDAWLNLIHVDDAVTAVLACDERGVGGTTYLVSDDQPLKRREYYESLAKQVGAPLPTFDETGQSETEARNLNKRCRNRKLREELGVELTYPTIASGLRQALGKEG